MRRLYTGKSRRGYGAILEAMAEPTASSPGSAAGGAPASPPAPPKFLQTLDLLIRARYPLLYLVSWEEQRVDALIEQLARTHGKALHFWSITTGLRRMAGGRSVPPADGTRDPGEALKA